MSDGVSTTTYDYNGDGDRVSQTVGGVTTTYVIDAAAPLTMVLAETTGTETIYYLHGLDLVAQSDGATTEYFAYDGLGSVRQVLSSAGEVLYGQGFDPYGNTYMSAGDEKPSWGFTGEQTDSNGLIFLRARYYQPQTGRFVSRDPWKGDMNQPVSYNAWLYGYGNPVKYKDPSGHYGITVHYQVTLDMAKSMSQIHCNKAGCLWAAYWIAKGNENVDEFPLSADPRGGNPQLHFEDQTVAFRNAKSAVEQSEPYLLGAALHQVQDWYSHWSEGYRWPGTLGHASDSLRAGCGVGKECQRDRDLIESFYEKHPKEDVTSQLSKLYPSSEIGLVSDDKLIDLYLREYTKPGDRERSLWGYGYDTDHYFEFSNRELMMRVDTSLWLIHFYLNLDPCISANFLPGYNPPSDEKVLDFLKTGEYHP